MSADVEAVLVTALPPVLGVPVATEVPNPRPAEFVRVTATGGPPIELLVQDRATVAWEAWGPTPAAAVELALRVRAAINALAGHSVGGTFIVDSSSTRPRWFPDESGQPRYVGSCELLIHRI